MKLAWTLLFVTGPAAVAGHSTRGGITTEERKLVTGCLPCDNPCVPNAPGKDRYFPYCDSTSKFIQCDEWGGCYTQDCAPGTVWNQGVLTCTTGPGEPSNPCLPNPCLNGATCVPAGGSFSCTCTPEFTGDLCEIPADEGEDCSMDSECAPGLCQENECVDDVCDVACDTDPSVCRGVCSLCIGGFCDSCFPRDALVEVEGKGFVTMKSLQLGDKVRSGSGFSEVYAFGSRTMDNMITFLKLTTESYHKLELTKNHMVFTGPEMKARLAGEVKVGDSVMLMPQMELSKVISIDTISKQGAVHPMTYDGSVVVNGVLASVHSDDTAKAVVKLGGFYLLDSQRFEQMLLAPLRLLCRLSPDQFCSEANHWKDDGCHPFIDITENLKAFLMPERVQKSRFEEIHFLKISAFLPFKVFVLFWMVLFSIIDFTLENMSTLHFMLAVMAFGGIILFRKKPVMFRVVKNKKEV